MNFHDLRLTFLYISFCLSRNVNVYNMWHKKEGVVKSVGKGNLIYEMVLRELVS